MCMDDDDGDLLETIFKSLHDLRNHLEEIYADRQWTGEYSFRWYEQLEQPRYVIFNDTLTPLFGFSQLQRLRISRCDTGFYDLDDEVLIQIFNALSGLKSFDLEDISFKPDEPPYITLAGVQQALQATPDLQSLTLRFDATSLPDSGLDIPPHQSLKFLNVCTSPIGCGPAFGEWWVKNIPNLAKVDSFASYRQGLKDMFCDGQVVELERAYVEPYEVASLMVDRWNDVVHAVRENSKRRKGGV
ncbi:hypothetical protein CC2G_002944 [Coprinopsis cinerea AmutBmut pab1-1]|nr:hypothetical protein CC2G_002944 [Coprinopsis cinerea AmutBmut pab1-1]